jgi:hypothetical protein
MKYYINKDGNYCSYNYIPSFTEEDGMAEITEEEYSTEISRREEEYYATLEGRTVNGT